MRSRAMRIFSGLKYVGLLGLPGLVFKHPVFDYLWLFWLFGLLEILCNAPLFVQSLGQIWGMIYVPLRYGKNIPGKDNYRCKIQYSLPFFGAWTVVNGSVEKEYSHSWDIPVQRYAYDFIVLDESGKSHAGDTKQAESYHCYGREILAPADGEVAELQGNYKESRISGDGRADCAAPDMRGNYILIRHAQGEYSLLAHLQPGSINVKVGETVKRGQGIARCGNSGNSSEPHLHFQLQNGVSFTCSAGLPITFTDVAAASVPNYAAMDPRPVPPMPAQPGHIARGQLVRNI